MSTSGLDGARLEVLRAMGPGSPPACPAPARWEGLGRTTGLHSDRKGQGQYTNPDGVIIHCVSTGFVWCRQRLKGGKAMALAG